MSKLACLAATRTSTTWGRRRWQTWPQGAKRGQPGADCARHACLEYARHRSSQRTGLRDVGRPGKDGAVHQGALPQILALELQHRAAANFWTGSATIAILRIGASISTTPGRRRSKAAAELPPANAVWNTAPKYRFELKYPRGVTMTIAGGYPDIKTGVKWIGTEGWVWVDRDGFDASNPAWKQGKYLPRELRKVKLYTSADHQQNFLDCIKTRQATVTPVEVGHQLRASRTPLPYLDAHRKKDSVGCEGREDHRRSGSQQIDDARIPCALEDELEIHWPTMEWLIQLEEQCP